ncbi:MAG: YceD family protein [Erysipelotrichaceae bacterium]
MNFVKNELINKNQIKFTESIKFNKDTFINQSLLRDLKDIEVSGEGYYDITKEKFYIEAMISGIMIVPCALSDVDVDYAFSSEMSVIYSFAKAEEDEVQVKGPIVNTMPEILQSIIMEVPLKVVSKNAEYKRGKNWEVVSEKKLNSEEKAIDPRLAKLKEFKFSDD